MHTLLLPNVFGERFASKKDFLLLEVNMARVPEPNVYLAICKPPELFRLRKWRQSVGSDNYAGSRCPAAILRKPGRGRRFTRRRGNRWYVPMVRSLFCPINIVAHGGSHVVIVILPIAWKSKKNICFLLFSALPLWVLIVGQPSEPQEAYLSQATRQSKGRPNPK